MKFCSKCGKQMVDEAIVCPGCGCAVSDTSTPNTRSLFGDGTDVVSVGLCVLAFFIPLFGIIYWAAKGKETPKRARACGITGILSWAISFIFSILFFTAIIAAM